MANPQTENGYTVICNEILEAISKTKLNGTQFRIVMVIWRSTYGWKKKEHNISETFLANATGIHKKQIGREIKALIEKKIITVIKDATRTESRVMMFNKNHEEWELISREGTKTLGGNENAPTGGNELAGTGGNENAPQKNNIKNNIKNKVNYREILDNYHNICISYPKLRGLSDTRKKHLNARITEHGYESLKEIFGIMESSSFMKGGNDRGWWASIDWIIKPNNYLKAIEGKYGKKQESKKEYLQELSIEEIERLKRES